jgi:hypothetical protein
MGLVISKGLTLRKDYRSAFADPDVQAYLSAVEQADGQALEYPVAYAVDEFVRGCKADGIWSAIKASCILAGARTLTGALTPLVGTAPTSFNFVDDDYNRKTGLVGDGSTKYLDSNRNNNADPQNSRHFSIYLSDPGSGITSLVMGCGAAADGGRSSFARVYSPSGDFFRCSNANGTGVGTADSINFHGVSRSTSGSFIVRKTGVETTVSQVAETPQNENLGVLARATGAGHSNVRAAFYSIGESLDLALLDARVTDLINAFGAAIP